MESLQETFIHNFSHSVHDAVAGRLSNEELVIRLDELQDVLVGRDTLDMRQKFPVMQVPALRIEVLNNSPTRDLRSDFSLMFRQSKTTRFTKGQLMVLASALVDKYTLDAQARAIMHPTREQLPAQNPPASTPPPIRVAASIAMPNAAEFRARVKAESQARMAKAMADLQAKKRKTGDGN